MTWYAIGTAERITVGYFARAIDCPVCGADRGLCLSTSGAGHPVTGSCPADHVWDERRVTGADVMDKAIEMSREDR